MNTRKPRAGASHFATVAALLRAKVVRIRQRRQVRRELVRELRRYLVRLRVEDALDADLIARLRHAAKHLDADAERAERQRRRERQPSTWRAAA